MASTIRELDHLRIPLQEIFDATNNFADENIIGKGGLGNVYKGQLMRSGKLLNVSARRLIGRHGNVEFLTEISMLSSLKLHHYIVSMIGFCEEKGEKIIINNYQTKGSLMMHISDPASFTWIKRMKTSVQVAKAIRYLHGVEKWSTHLIIHRNINSSTILLDEHMFPRLSGFEYSIKVSIDRKDHIYLCEPLGTRGYMDPEILKKGGVNHKSDIYSFGVVLFEILCGRKAYQDNSFLAPLAKFHYEQGTLQDIIHPDLWKQMESKSFKCFSDVAYSCLQSDWTQRPDIKQVLDTLTKALKHDHFEPVENLIHVKSVISNYKKDHSEPEETLIDIKSTLSDYKKFGQNLENKVAKWEERLKMCIDVANKLNYLHNEMEVQKKLIRGDTNSRRIVEYRDSVFHNEIYIDPDFLETSMPSKESDVYSFGVVMFELLCGNKVREHLESGYYKGKGMAYMVQQWSDSEIIKKKMDDVLKGENGDSKLFLNKGPNEDSLDTFIKIACRCVLEERDQRPTMKVVIRELQKALTFQKNHKDKLRISFEDIKIATQNFSAAKLIGGGGFGKVYKGKLVDRNGKGSIPIVGKKLDTRHGQGDKEFYTELHILYEYKHDNIIGLVGYSNETNDKIIVYERASKGSLDKYLSDANLTWRNRLKICIDFATGLDFLHQAADGKHVVIHRDIKSSNILLFDDWKAKVGDFGLSLISAINGRENYYTIDNVCGTSGYVDPLYLKSGMLTIESDIYSFGVVLLEIFCGKAIYEIHIYENESLLSSIERNFDYLTFDPIKEEIVPKSLTPFLEIMSQCLHDDRQRRPPAKNVLKHLIRAWNFQEEQGNNFRMSLEDIKLATQNFSLANEIERGSFGSVYKGEFVQEDGTQIYIAVAKKFDSSISQAKKQYYNEFQHVSGYKHENIISLVGYSNEMDEKILVYEYASKGSLDNNLNDASLTWTNRLKICIDIATGLKFVHDGVDGKEVVIHRNIKSSNILLFDDWKAKIGGFGLSCENSTNRTIDLASNTSGYLDPLYLTSGMLIKESDIYSLGVVLFEILRGKVVYKIHKLYGSESLLTYIKHNYVVFKGIKEEIAPKSLTTFLNIIYKCLDDDPKKRPTLEEVIQQLRRTIEIQEDYDLGCCLGFVMRLINCLNV